MKFLLIILTTSNEKLLKISYESCLNQKHHNLDYHIIINVNSLNKNYYNDVITEFKNFNVEIIQTQSNGKPGMGHNSCIELFKNRKQFDYMLLLDGDDFLYPYALHQLSKCFNIHSHLDILMLKSTDKIKVKQSHFPIDSFKNINQIKNSNESTQYDIFDIMLNNNFYISTKTYVDYKLYPWNKQHITLSNFYNNSLCTPFRLFLLNRNIFNYIQNDLFHSQCSLYDDYITFLYFVRLSLNKNLKTFIIPGKYIYLYNGININSQTNQNYTDDMIYYDKLKNEFNDVYNFLGNDWNITKLPTLYISHYKNNNINYTIDTDNFNISMNINFTDIYNDPNYIYTYNFGIDILNKIINTYFYNTIKYINYNDYNNSLKYSSFFDENNLKHPYISFVFIYSIFNIYNINIPYKYCKNIKTHIYVANVILKFYNNHKLNDYCNNILLTSIS